MKNSLAGAVLAMSMAAIVQPSYADDEIEITLIHTGDFHGHLIPRPNLRSDGDGRMEGGLARVYSRIKKIREKSDNTLLLHTGDTIQGGAEVLYTRGEAILKVVNEFGIDAFAPGNWEFVYGTERFVELFSDKFGNTPVANFKTVSANLRYCGEPFANKDGERVVDPYIIKNVAGIKVGILGFTTDRGPQVVGTTVTKGFCFLSSVPGSSGTPDVSQVEAELRAQVDHLRNVEKVDLLVMISELGLANNTLLAERNDGIDVILSSDMHEETREPAVVTTPNGGKTLVMEAGQDGTMLGELELEFNKKTKKLKEWEFKAHRISDRIDEDRNIARLVKNVRKPFVAGEDFVAHENPFHHGTLRTPIDTVVGHTDVALHRSNFAGEAMPAVIEGSSHDFLTDAFRAITGADVAAIRGFRYGSHMMGAMKLEDLYHYMPIGPQIARGTMKGRAIKGQAENSSNGSMNADPRNWTGGWVFGFSGMTFSIDPYATYVNPAVATTTNDGRTFNFEVEGKGALTLGGNYTYSSYWYGGDNPDKCLLNRVALVQPTPGDCPSLQIAVRDNDNGGKARFVSYNEWAILPAEDRMDGTEVVVQYLQDNLGGMVTSANLSLNRISVVDKVTGNAVVMPAPVYGDPEIQPLRGAQ